MDTTSKEFEDALTLFMYGAQAVVTTRSQTFNKTCGNCQRSYIGRIGTRAVYVCDKPLTGTVVLVRTTKACIFWQADTDPDETPEGGVEQEEHDFYPPSSGGAKNNDGRATCYACGAPTRKCGGMSYGVDYRVCTLCGK